MKPSCIIITVSSETEIVGRRVYGKKMLKFVCKFKTEKEKNVTWYLNDKYIDPNHDAFEVTHMYKAKKNLVISTMEIVNPRVIYFGNYLFCKLDDKKQQFHDVIGKCIPK